MLRPRMSSPLESEPRRVLDWPLHPDLCLERDVGIKDDYTLLQMSSNMTLLHSWGTGSGGGRPHAGLPVTPDDACWPRGISVRPRASDREEVSGTRAVRTPCLAQTLGDQMPLHCRRLSRQKPNMQLQVTATFRNKGQPDVIYYQLQKKICNKSAWCAEWD